MTLNLSSHDAVKLGLIGLAIIGTGVGMGFLFNPLTGLAVAAGLLLALALLVAIDKCSTVNCFSFTSNEQTRRNNACNEQKTAYVSN